MQDKSSAAAFNVGTTRVETDHVTVTTAPRSRRVAFRKTNAPVLRKGATLGAVLITVGAAFATAWSVWRSPVLGDPRTTAVVGGLVVLGVGLAGSFTWWRRPRSRFGPLVLGLGALYALGSLTAFASPAVFTLGRLALAAFVIAYGYVALAFPYGQLRDGVARRTIAAAAFGSAVLWLAELLLAETLPRGYMLTDCFGACPANPYALVRSATLSAWLGDVTRVTTLCAMVAVAAALLRQTLASRPPLRRGYLFVFGALLLVIAAFATCTAWQPTSSTGRHALTVIAAAGALAVPAGILLGQLLGHVISSWRLRELLRDAGSGALEIDEIEGRLRIALGDPTLTISVSHTTAREDDARLDRAPRRRRHSLVLDGVVLGTMTYDGLIDDEAGLAEAFGVATLACYAHHTLVDQLRQTRHVAEAAINERAALERDLHDGAAQRVLSLQVGLAQARSHAGSEAMATTLAQLERHAQLLHDDLRELSHGIFPPVLVDCGVVEALAEATLVTNQRARISGTIGRMPRHLEHTLYFTALEAVQNVLAHAGTWAIATVAFAQTADTVVCRISDDGVGFDTEGSEGDGLGLASMRERVTSVGGTFSIESAPGRGTSVVAEIPFREESE